MKTNMEKKPQTLEEWAAHFRKRQNEMLKYDPELHKHVLEWLEKNNKNSKQI